MNAPRRLLPSTSAASSSSFGMLMMKPRSVHTANGSTNVRYVMISAAERVHLVVAGEHDVQRDDQPRLRQHLDPDHQDDEDLQPGEAILRERDRREEGEHHRDRDRDEHDDDAVLHVLPEVRLRASRRGSGRASDAAGTSRLQAMIPESGLKAVETIQ